MKDVGSEAKKFRDVKTTREILNETTMEKVMGQLTQLLI